MQLTPDGRLFVCEQGGNQRDQERRANADAVRVAGLGLRTASADCSAWRSIQISASNQFVYL
jgi:hypothetical protein